MAVAYARFLRTLPHPARNLILLAACLYVGGALGGEYIHTFLTARRLLNLGDHRTLIFVNASFEEFFEMVGVAVFIYGLLVYMWVVRGTVTIDVAHEGRPEPPSASRANDAREGDTGEAGKRLAAPLGGPRR